jgi:signal transduction histidine kinase
LSSATTVLRLQKLTDLLYEDSRKYFVTLDPIYEKQFADFRSDFVQELAQLQKTAASRRERASAENLAAAAKVYWAAFDRLVEEKTSGGPDDLPPYVTSAADHLQAVAEVALDAVQLSIKEQVAGAADVGQRAERVAWLAGMGSLLLGVVVAAVNVRSTNDTFRRLTKGTRAIAKGEFWHRLPAHGSDEFAELARDFNVMTEKLGELDRMKKDFVSHVSHDLKAPLASIRQIMHLLLQQIPGALNEQQENLIQLSYNSAERLASMVGNLLDVSRMEAGTMEYQMANHDIMPIVKLVMDEFDIQAREKGIRLTMECDQLCVFAKCDRERIVQVVGNLFENALKFSPNNSQIVTRVGHGKGGEILVAVCDSGPGVPDAHKEKIFHKFHQVKSGKKMAGQGVGLGLAICTTIVEAHHGQIWVEDNPAGGSVFSFVLQAAANEEVLKCGQPA